MEPQFDTQFMRDFVEISRNRSADDGGVRRNMDTYYQNLLSTPTESVPVQNAPGFSYDPIRRTFSTNEIIESVVAPVSSLEEMRDNIFSRLNEERDERNQGLFNREFIGQFSDRETPIFNVRPQDERVTAEYGGGVRPPEDAPFEEDDHLEIFEENKELEAMNVRLREAVVFAIRMADNPEYVRRMIDDSFPNVVE